MSSETYRVYCLDGAGHLHEPEWFDAESIEDAIAQTRAKRPDAMCEICMADGLSPASRPIAFGLNREGRMSRSLFIGVIALLIAALALVILYFRQGVPMPKGRRGLV